MAKFKNDRLVLRRVMGAPTFIGKHSDPTFPGTDDIKLVPIRDVADGGVFFTRPHKGQWVRVKMASSTSSADRVIIYNEYDNRYQYVSPDKLVCVRKSS